MNVITKVALSIVVMVNLSGCLYGQCIDGPCALERAKIIQSIKPYGAHWVKAGMTNEQRLIDWTRCGGAENLSDGYEKQSGQSNSEFFDGLRLHRMKIRSCMDSKGYVWIER
jgi:hypothetical protein